MVDILDMKALDRQVLAVAVKGSVDDWAAYIGAVAGMNHYQEAPQVARTGSKLSKKIAVILFPSLDESKYRE